MRKSSCASVGIFWGILNPNNSWTILTDHTELSDAERYSDFLKHPRGHHDVLEAWQSLGVTGLMRVSVFCGKPDPNSDGCEIKFFEPFMMYITMAEDNGWLLECINVFKTNGDLAGSRTGMDIMRYLTHRANIKL